MNLDAMRKLFLMLTVGLFVGALAACEEQSAGDAVDNAAEQAGEAAEQAGDAVEEAAEEAGEAAEEATSN